MRLLLSSNAPWCNTGYGVQARSLLPRLSAQPCVGGAENVSLFAWYGVQGGMTQYGPWPVYPGHGDVYGRDVIGKHAAHFGADVVITLIDVWTQQGVGEIVAPAKWLPWFPVDTEPVAKRVVDSLAGAHLPVVYSRHGEKALRAVGVNSAYVPHGIEPDIFKLLPDEEAKDLRQMVWGEGCTHATLMVAANKAGDRKAFAVNLRAWAAFAKEYGPGARLYVHTDPTRAAGGLDLVELAHACGIAEGQIVLPDRYSYYLGYPAEWMALVYNAADVLLAASMSEGFGIPLIEAQACGTPVITTDWTSMPELVTWGYAVRVRDKVWSNLGGWWALPDVDEVRRAVWRVGRLKQEPDAAESRVRTSATMHALYGWDVVVEKYWQPVLEEVANVVG